MINHLVTIVLFGVWVAMMFVTPPTNMPPIEPCDPDKCERIGIFSEAALRHSGGVYYTSSADPSGEVLVTCVGSDMKWVEQKYNWSDKMFVGCVGEYIRPGGQRRTKFLF